MTVKKAFGLGLMIVLIALFISINNVNGAYMDDYISIANANDSIKNTFVYEDYFYVVNETEILKYYLEDGSLTDSYEIIDYMTSINRVLRKGFEVYIDMTYGGNRYFMCFDLIAFEEMNRTLYTEIHDGSAYAVNIWNYIYYEFGDNGYWLYGYGYGSVSSDEAIQSNMFKMSYDEIAPYENFGVVLSLTGHTSATHVGDWYNRIYVYNTTDSSTTQYNKACGAVGTNKNLFAYSGLIYNASGINWFNSDLCGVQVQTLYYDGGEEYGMEDCFNMQSEITMQENGRMYSYATFGIATIRGDLSIEKIADAYPTKLKHIWFWDLDSTNDEVIAHCNFRIDEAPNNKFYRAYNREGDGFGEWSLFRTNYNPNFWGWYDGPWYSNDKIGQASFGSYTTFTGYENFYAGYVNYTNLVPIAERIVLESGNDIVSSFDYDDVVECKIFNADLNLVAIFTRENDSTLYVLRNLIDRDELESGGYTTPTLQFISANLYTIVGGEKVVSDGWLFMGEVYQVESVIQNMSYYYLTLDDGENTIRFYYENSTKSLNVTASDELVIGLIYANVEAVNETLEKYNCEWRFILGKNIVDSPSNITITYYGKNTIADEEVSGTAITGLKIYNLGGFVYYDFGGDGGKIEGGDALELYATNGSTSSYAKAEIIFRKLQHTHLLVEIDMDNDFDTDHLDFPLGCGFVEYGFDYRLDGVWVEGWNTKIYVTDARVGRYGAGIDSSWVELEIDWYNKAHQVGIIKDDYIYSYHYGYDKDADYAPRKSIILWVDLWFNRMNASTVIGGRVNSYEHGMYEAGSTWWFGYGNFRPKIGNATASMFFDDLYDGDGDLISCKPFELIKMWAKVEKINDANGNDDTWTLKNYEILNWKLADDRMEGVDTPVFVETKDPSMPKTGFVSPIVSAIQGISTAISKAMFNMVKLLIGALDSILVNVLNSPVSMTQMIEWISIQSSYIVTWMAQVIARASDMLNIFTIMMTFILQLIDNAVGVIMWISTNVIGFPIVILNMFIEIFNDGVFTLYGVTYDWSSGNQLIQGFLTLLPLFLGWWFVMWILYDNIYGDRNIDIQGVPRRLLSIFSWMGEIYNSVFWIFNRMRNEIISLYNFIRSHIPQIGGGGGETKE